MAEGKAALASIAIVAKDLSGRAKAEFNAEDLYLACRAFGTDSFKGLKALTHGALRWDASARKLRDALAMRRDRCVWVVAAQIAVLPCRAGGPKSGAPAPRRLVAMPPSTIGWCGVRRWAQ